MNSLKELYKQHQGKISDKWDIYLSEYDRLFSPYRMLSVNLLEIGVQNGGSLEIWSKYFLQGNKFIGCDINHDCATLKYDDSRISIVVGDATSDNTEAEIKKLTNSFDLIIDDGSHTSGDIIKSFSRYFLSLNTGGLFIAEDLHCSYWQAFEGGLYHPYSSISFFKCLADVVNYEHWGVKKDRKKILSGISNHFSVVFSEEMLESVHSVEFINSMCVIRKMSGGLNKLGSRIFAGQVEQVVPVSHLSDCPMHAGTNESENEWSALDESPDESFKLLKRSLEYSMITLAERDAQISVLNQTFADREVQIAVLDQIIAKRDVQIAGLAHEVNALRNSISWRLTKPLRVVGNQIAQGNHLLKIAPDAFRVGGGPRATLKKALALYKSEGFAGVKRGIQMAQTAGKITPAVGSDAFDRNDYAEWVRRFDTMDDAKWARLGALCDSLGNQPKISVVMPTYNPTPEWLIEAIESVRNQIYPNWELCIADDASPNREVRQILERYGRDDKRIKVVFREKNGHISAASNSALALATGDWVALLDHDDILPEHALALVAQAIAAHPDAGLIYSDEDKIDYAGQRSSPYFKSDWNPELFRSQNMICHLGVYRRDLVMQSGGFRLGFEGSQDHDLALRCTEQLGNHQIIHIPHVLYHWRAHAESTAMSSDIKSYAQDTGLKAIREHLQRSGIAGDVELTPFLHYRVRYSVPSQAPRVSLIIPTRNGLHLIRQCIESIIGKTTYPNYEILIVDNGSDDPATLAYFESLKQNPAIKILRDDRPFNYSALNNAAVAVASGELIGLINNDIQVITPEWLDEMVGLAVQTDVGAVGARLLYPDNTLQHGGVILGIGGVAGHSHKRFPSTDFGYFNRAQLTQSLSAVTAACLVIRKSIFLDVGGLNSVDLAIAFNDIDFCLKVRKAGYRNVWTPFAELYHHESATRGFEDTPEKKTRFSKEVTYMRGCWGNELAVDPYYNPNLTLDCEDFSLAWPPRAIHRS